jgi:hypothetical protein
MQVGNNGVSTDAPRACRMQCYRERKVSRRVTTDHVMPLLPRAQQMVLPPAPVRPWFCRSGVSPW